MCIGSRLLQYPIIVAYGVQHYSNFFLGLLYVVIPPLHVLTDISYDIVWKVTTYTFCSQFCCTVYETSALFMCIDSNIWSHLLFSLVSIIQQHATWQYNFFGLLYVVITPLHALASMSYDIIVRKVTNYTFSSMFCCTVY